MSAGAESFRDGETRKQMPPRSTTGDDRAKGCDLIHKRGWTWARSRAGEKRGTSGRPCR